MNLKVVIYLLMFVSINYANAEDYFDHEIEGLPSRYKVQSSNSESKGHLIKIVDSKKNYKSEIFEFDSVVFSINYFKFVELGPSRKPFVILFFTKAPHGEWAFIYDLSNIEKGKFSVVKSYYAFDDFKVSATEEKIIFYGSSYSSASSKKPIIPIVWKP